ncbi:MAG: acetyltransferase [Rhodanobacteraceae bacterium]|nr:MAG: acetyltransferase [Rhodanobacteraceae bacterium]
MSAQKQSPDTDRHALAEAVRKACLKAALDGYERAGMSGLCEEGRWEMVVDSLQSLDVDAIVRTLAADAHAGTAGSGK